MDLVIPNATDEIGVGIIGTGMMGKCHSLAFNAVKATFGNVPRPRLELLCDVEEQHVKEKASELGFARHTTDWRSLVTDPDIQIVSITTPNSCHPEMAIAALEAGKHVYCEKPMALTLEDAEAMTAAAREASGLTLLGYGFTKNPALLHAKRLIEAGTIGRVFDFRGAIDEDYVADSQLPWTWRLNEGSAGLGSLGDLMCHLVSLAHMLLGPILEVSGLMETVHKTRPILGEPQRQQAVENDDIAHAIVRFETGVAGVISSSRIAHGRKNGIRIEIHGSQGMITFDQERMNELQLYTADGSTEISGFRTILTGPQHWPYGLFCPMPGHSLGYNELKVIEVAHFLQAVRGLEKPFPNFEDGLRIERVIHSFPRTAQKRSWVTV
jgi:predicted dehydrogenase